MKITLALLLLLSGNLFAQTKKNREVYDLVLISDNYRFHIKSKSSGLYKRYDAKKDTIIATAYKAKDGTDSFRIAANFKEKIKSVELNFSINDTAFKVVDYTFFHNHWDADSSFIEYASIDKISTDIVTEFNNIKSGYLLYFQGIKVIPDNKSEALMRSVRPFVISVE